MNKTHTISVIGGDSRQLYAAEHFINMGYKTKLFNCELENITDKKNYCKNLGEAMESEIILLPLPVTKNNKIINAPLSDENISLNTLTGFLEENHKVFLGMAPGAVFRQIKGSAGFVYDYFTDESLIYKNALLTAEGLISIITNKIPLTINGLKIAITGYGRIAGCTAQMLKSLNAEVFIFARNKLQITKANLAGLKANNIETMKNHIDKFDCLINTVPHRIISKELLEKTKKDCLIIEAASAPYGIDSEACNSLQKNFIKAFSLPGKTSPKSAGIIIAETVNEIIKEELK